MAEVVSTRLGTGLLERLDDVRGDASRSAWLATILERELTASTSAPVAASRPGAAIGTLGRGTPSPGVACAGPGCWQRDTSRYGLRGLILCDACAHAACGQPYTRPQRDLPANWRRAAKAPV